MAFKNLITIYYKDYILYKCLKNINCISFNNSGIKNKSDYSGYFTLRPDSYNILTAVSFMARDFYDSRRWMGGGGLGKT